MLHSPILQLLTLLISIQGVAFSIPEPSVWAAPDTVVQMELAPGEAVLDLDVSPTGQEVLVLVEANGGGTNLRTWGLNSSAPEKFWNVPAGLQAKSIAWHPQEHAFFLLARRGKASVILKVVQEKGSWKAGTIFETQATLRRLVVGPRPFNTGKKWDFTEYRLFFGQNDSAGGFSIHSITERGKKPYQVIGKNVEMIPGLEDFEQASSMVSASALPLGFHPAGHMLFWEDARSCFEVAEYVGKAWANSSPVLNGKLCGGTVTLSPNGLALLHWMPGTEGLESLMMNGKLRERQCRGFKFAFTPSSVPDGKGVVGVVKSGDHSILAYVPIKVPLADVTNAWMFIETDNDLQRLSASGSLLRNTDFEQVFNLYDTEKYSCGEYDRSVPTRPYLVTTDAFWEIFAAAFEGLFVMSEKQTAIPAFWMFVTDAARYFNQTAGGSHWSKVFNALAAFKLGNPLGDPEAKLIQAGEGAWDSPVLGTKVNYGLLKPRGHYASSPEFQMYFKGFTYLTRLASQKPEDVRELDKAPPALKQKALTWIAPYRNFIADSRSPLAWSPSLFQKPAYNKYPQPLAKMFPLSWGMDNEILNSTVYHIDWPEPDQIFGANGKPRLMASTLDLPAALGNPLALELMQKEFNSYPKLKNVMLDLKKRPWPGHGDSANLYDQWMNSLNIQWAGAPERPTNKQDWTEWDTKRLQTGLASWATLRHTTLLVNETSAAECGEGGYEEIVLRHPRGYVEPDPATFNAIAGLFDAAAAKLRALPLTPTTVPKSWEDTAGAQALQQGLLKRLLESSKAARYFGAMAEKELRGRALSDSEYESILDFGKVAEHHFLIYKSLSTEGQGLAKPDPIAKIADVAHGPLGKPYLFAAVGNPVEWNQVTPFFGRRQVVKGAAYSYYELTSDTLFNDKEWQTNLTKRKRPAWIQPLVIDRALACPAKNHF